MMKADRLVPKLEDCLMKKKGNLIKARNHFVGPKLSAEEHFQTIEESSLVKLLASSSLILYLII